MLPIIVHPKASAELSLAATWYETRTPGIGGAFLAEVDRALQSIAEAPTAWPRLKDAPRDADLRRFLLPRFPFSIIYRTESSRVFIFAIAHAKRHPRYWLGRLRNV